MPSKLQLLYGANVAIAGFAGVATLVAPSFAKSFLWDGLVESPSFATAALGWIWTTIALLSVLGYSRPLEFSPIALVQLIYKAAWLAFGVLPSALAGRPFPVLFSLLFVAYTVVLLAVIPWGHLFPKAKARRA